MSADNYAVIAQHPEDKRWYLLQGFASEDEFCPLVDVARWYETEEHAIIGADRDYFEYGYSTGEWPEHWYEYAECPTCEDFTLRVRRTLSDIQTNKQG